MFKKYQDKDNQIIPKSNSPMRQMIAEANSLNYKSYDNLETAKNNIDSFLIMEGDYGGQIYLVCPVNIIACSEITLNKLLFEIDSLNWDDEDGAALYYEKQDISQISGGMGGGIALNDLWVHERIIDYKDIILNVICGKSESIL